MFIFLIIYLYRNTFCCFSLGLFIFLYHFFWIRKFNKFYRHSYKRARTMKKKSTSARNEGPRSTDSFYCRASDQRHDSVARVRLSTRTRWTLARLHTRLCTTDISDASFPVSRISQELSQTTGSSVFHDQSFLSLYPLRGTFFSSPAQLVRNLRQLDGGSHFHFMLFICSLNMATGTWVLTNGSLPQFSYHTFSFIVTRHVCWEFKKHLPSICFSLKTMQSHSTLHCVIFCWLFLHGYNLRGF